MIYLIIEFLNSDDVINLASSCKVYYKKIMNPYYYQKIFKLKSIEP